MEALGAGNLAVVTGAAGGIGLAVAERLVARGMRVYLVDRAASVTERASALGDAATGFVVDVSDRAAVDALAAEIHARFGAVSFLMNNAAISGGADALSGPAIWDQVIGVNLMGVLHGVQAFVPAMIESGRPAMIVNTGSKQGITQPPGNTAYNVSKSGVKALTEGLAHTLLETTGDRLTAHLLIPGFTFTGMTGGGGEKPDAAWSAGQVADFLFERLAQGDFYVLCPDNDVARSMDEKRMAWAMGDVIENRPALSRWHPRYKEAFAAFMQG
ncbi:SDR family NAD(P)-dependent oxidoreductase [Sphingomonas kyeonggiensis]|uniref:NAD(P)-dependent dehydrogenase (Short-subunit alcohol dehydrogenase family) n=1 Tax=Sphingomonas kyeonggiensis TaxID=1268553 RepID=A0A7W6JVW2_9SPHN|nr:SDR family NAD(P)-dependent oxidoreductase [Sphingomonas kyeonggiensis]MBB4100511.1 NAD(P)-dependent dehydrogenase (short-subunit alcohol dehydrogenase family) [Sphingomonas kyeonggiensis]